MALTPSGILLTLEGDKRLCLQLHIVALIEVSGLSGVNAMSGFIPLLLRMCSQYGSVFA